MSTSFFPVAQTSYQRTTPSKFLFKEQHQAKPHITKRKVHTMNSRLLIVCLLLSTFSRANNIVPSASNNNFCRSTSCEQCIELPTVYQRSLCFEDWFRTIVQQNASQFLPATCAAIQLQTRHVVFDCHWLMHGVAEGMFHSEDSVAAAGSKQLTMGQLQQQTLENYARCVIACDWACYHAVAASYVRELVQRNTAAAPGAPGATVTTNFFVTALDDLCALLAASQTGTMVSAIYFQCYHGVGHGVIWVWKSGHVDNAAPIMPVNSALHICDSLQGFQITGQHFPLAMTAYFCRTGLYMQLWENQMKNLRNGRDDQTFQELRPAIVNRMRQLCRDHNLVDVECGELWGVAGLLETDGNKMLSKKLCDSAYQEMVVPNVKVKQKCQQFVDERPPPESNGNAASYCPDNCGILCETTNTITTTTRAPEILAPSSTAAVTPTPTPTPTPTLTPADYTSANSQTSTTKSITTPTSTVDDSDGNDTFFTKWGVDQDTLNNFMMAAGAASIVICLCLCFAVVWKCTCNAWSYDRVGGDDAESGEKEGMVQMSVWDNRENNI